MKVLNEYFLNLSYFFWIFTTLVQHCFFIKKTMKNTMTKKNIIKPIIVEAVNVRKIVASQ